MGRRGADVGMKSKHKTTGKSYEAITPKRGKRQPSRLDKKKGGEQVRKVGNKKTVRVEIAAR